jgi:hypothetical protein
MINKKGLAERTIGLILIGLIVLAIMTYWVYKTSRQEPMGFQECNALWVQWCLKCKSMSANPCSNWDVINTPNDVRNCTDIVGKGLGVNLNLDDNCQTSRPDCLTYFDATGTLSCS